MNMNPAHWHLLVNHIPIIGGLFSTFVWANAVIKKENQVLRLSYILFIICALSSILASNTGEWAGHYLKGLNKIEDFYLERHMQLPDISNIGMIILGAVSLFTLVVKKIAILKFIPILILIFALMVSGFMFYTRKLGGENMHKEIRIDPGTKLWNDW